MSFAVVNTDNFGGDYPNETFTLRGISTEKAAIKIADAINDELCRDDHAPRYWKVVEEPYQLQPGFEP